MSSGESMCLFVVLPPLIIISSFFNIITNSNHVISENTYKQYLFVSLKLNDGFIIESIKFCLDI